MIFNFKKILLFLFLFVILSGKIIFSQSVDECSNKELNTDEMNRCITEIIPKRIAELEKSIAPLEKETVGLKSKITSAKSQISNIEKQVVSLGQKLAKKETELKKQTTLMGERVKRYYINSKKFNPLLIFLANKEGTSLLQQYTWYQAIISQDKNTITGYTSDITTLNSDKINLELQKNKLASLKLNLENRFGFLAGEIKKAEVYKAELNQNLLKLLEAERIKSLNLPTSAGSGGIFCVDDRTIDPGFGAGFAFYTFGIPHHVGLNQYGALGRAKAGQSAEDIIRAYYQNIEISGGKEGESIKVNGTNEFGQNFSNETMNIEEYLKHIYEMPTSWPEAALQAQAMAARSYALRVYSEKGYLYPSQKDQVIKKELNNDRWISAVNATKGKVIISDGKPIKAWFASTAGGYTFTSGDVWGGQTSWTKRLRDTNGDINSFEDLFNKAYDKDSKCFYAAQGYRKEYNKSAWLKPSEVADIVNTILLGQKDSSTLVYLCQPDVSGGRCKVKQSDGTYKYYDVWDVEKVKTELRNRGITPFNSISSASITDWNKNEGRVNKISLSGDVGSVNFDGSDFKTYFNSRAPANIAIVGPLFNIEKR